MPKVVVDDTGLVKSVVSAAVLGTISFLSGEHDDMI